MNVPALDQFAPISQVTLHPIQISGKRSHSHAALTTRTQPYLIIRIEDTAGQTGYGEVATAGGPWWGGDSVESVAATIEAHLIPVLIGQKVASIGALMARLDRVVYDAPYAKAGLEMALLDLQGKTMGVPVSFLLGGAREDRFDISWPLGAGDAVQDIEIARVMQGQGISRFKVKMGAMSVEQDMARALEIARALADSCDLRIDLNAAWREAEARRHLSQLVAAGYGAIEQPLPRTEYLGHARLGQSSPAVTLMADESFGSFESLAQIIDTGAFGALSLKPMKSGGMFNTLRAAMAARRAGLALFGGCFLETSLGTAANLQLGAALGELDLGCEWMGPLWLRDDIVDTPIKYSQGQVFVPEVSGLGVRVNDEKLKEFAT